jgi:hypothetical protein
MSTTVNPIQAQRSTGSTLRTLLWVAPVAMAAATVANLALYVIAGTLFPAVAAWPGAGPGQIVGATGAYLLFGAIALTLIARFSSRPARHFLLVAVVGLILSLALPVGAGFGYAAPGVPPASVATVVILALMHVISFAISVPLFVRLALDEGRRV